jgi:serine protease Do
MRSLFLLLFAVAGLVVRPCLGLGDESRLANRLTPAVRAVRQALPWVVNIGTQQVLQVNDGYDVFYNDFFKWYSPRSKEVTEYYPLGSGAIVDPRGLVVTNYHVVQRAQNIEIRLWNGDTHQAELVGFDMSNDLCLLRILGDFTDKPLATAVFALPDDLLLGETVLSVGNPFGLEHSVSQGVLSAINRNFEDSGNRYDDILQTDAAINPGNSGGPLINLNGELIGLNLAVRRDAEGIGFAIPMKRIEQFLSHWLLPERFSSACLGMVLDQPFVMGEKGIVLPEVMPCSDVHRVGLQQGDEVVAVNGQPIRRLVDFGRAVWTLRQGDEVQMSLADGRQVKTVVGTMRASKLIQTRLGLQVQKLTKNLNEALGFKADFRGVTISEIYPEGAFARQQARWRQVLKRGDVIIQAAEQVTPDAEALAEVLRASRSGQTLRFMVLCLEPHYKQYVSLAVDIILN